MQKQNKIIIAGFTLAIAAFAGFSLMPSTTSPTQVSALEPPTLTLDMGSSLKGQLSQTDFDNIGCMLPGTEYKNGDAFSFAGQDSTVVQKGIYLYHADQDMKVGEIFSSIKPVDNKILLAHYPYHLGENDYRLFGEDSKDSDYTIPASHGFFLMACETTTAANIKDADMESLADLPDLDKEGWVLFASDNEFDEQALKDNVDSIWQQRSKRYLRYHNNKMESVGFKSPMNLDSDYDPALNDQKLYWVKVHTPFNPSANPNEEELDNDENAEEGKENQNDDEVIDCSINDCPPSIDFNQDGVADVLQEIFTIQYLLSVDEELLPMEGMSATVDKATTFEVTLVPSALSDVEQKDPSPASPAVISALKSNDIKFNWSYDESNLTCVEYQNAPLSCTAKRQTPATSLSLEIEGLSPNFAYYKQELTIEIESLISSENAETAEQSENSNEQNCRPNGFSAVKVQNQLSLKQLVLEDAKLQSLSAFYTCDEEEPEDEAAEVDDTAENEEESEATESGYKINQDLFSDNVKSEYTLSDSQMDQIKNYLPTAEEDQSENSVNWLKIMGPVDTSTFDPSQIRAVQTSEESEDEEDENDDDNNSAFGKARFVSPDNGVVSPAMTNF